MFCNCIFIKMSPPSPLGLQLFSTVSDFTPTQRARWGAWSEERQRDFGYTRNATKRSSTTNLFRQHKTEAHCRVRKVLFGTQVHNKQDCSCGPSSTVKTLPILETFTRCTPQCKKMTTDAFLVYICPASWTLQVFWQRNNSQFQLQVRPLRVFLFCFVSVVFL